MSAPTTSGATTSTERLLSQGCSPDSIYLYPHPLTLARGRAEAERVRLADSSAYSQMCATWGSLGGLTTFYRYGTHYYRMLARRRWEKIGAEVLDEYVRTMKTTKMSRS